MELHEDNKLFRQAIQFTAEKYKLPAVYIEKDYWVTYILQNLFKHKVSTNIVFKGGTSLSKYFRIIDRFSEDIDLVIIRKEGESNNQMTQKIRHIGEVLNSILPEIFIDGVTQKRGMNRKTAHCRSKNTFNA